MGQETAIEFLRREYRRDPNQWFSRKEIVMGLGKGLPKGGHSYLGKALRILRKNGEVEYRRDDRSKLPDTNPRKPFLYKYKYFQSRILYKKD